MGLFHCKPLSGVRSTVAGPPLVAACTEGKAESSEAESKGAAAGEGECSSQLRLLADFGPTGDWLQVLLSKAIITNANPTVRSIAVSQFISDPHLFTDDAIKLDPVFISTRLPIF